MRILNIMLSEVDEWYLGSMVTYVYADLDICQTIFQTV